MVAAVASAVALACVPQAGAGRVAYTSGGALMMLDLSTCATRTVVPRGAAAPIAFSHDGRWISFGYGKVVSAAGGRVLRPVGAVWRWAWSPTRDELAGLTPGEALVEGGPSAAARIVTPVGWGANSFAWSSDGPSLAVGRGKFEGPATPKGVQQLVVFGPRGGRVIYTVPRGQVEPPLVSAWLGSRIYFQPDFANSASIAADGLSLLAIRETGGEPAKVVSAMLPGFGLVPCGTSTLVVAGGDRNIETNKRIVAYDGSSTHPVSSGRALAWGEPACSTDGHIVAGVGPDHPNASLIVPQRSIWSLSPMRRLTHSPTGWSDDDPAWTNNGEIVFLRQRFGKGSLYVVRASGGKLVGPLATGVSAFAVAP